jgi:hypothetical protein
VVSNNNLLGKTRFVEGIVVNSIGAFQSGRNQFTLFPFTVGNQIKNLAGKVNATLLESVTLDSHTPYQLVANKLCLLDRNTDIARNGTYVFLNKNIIAQKDRLELLIVDAILTRSGTDGRFPYQLPSA